MPIQKKKKIYICQEVTTRDEGDIRVPERGDADGRENRALMEMRVQAVIGSLLRFNEMVVSSLQESKLNAFQ